MQKTTWKRVLGVLIGAFLVGFCLSSTRAEISRQVIWRSGEDGYHTYRIPSVIQSANGTLLAFCEGRKGGRGDAGNIDLLLKRSVDGGQTWSRSEVVWDDGSNTCGNPCPVVDRSTGTIWLLLTHNLGIDHESDIVAGTSVGSRTVWVTSSRDDGVTWKEPQEITGTTKEADWTWYATGPGVGIQLRHAAHDGRMVIPCDHKVLGSKAMYSHVIYSDDHGMTWQLGGRSAEEKNNESQVVELSDGRLLLNMRHYDRDRGSRALSYSEDGGITWSGNFFNPNLIEPICQASLITARRGDQNLLVFSNPASRSSRTRMMVKVSEDEGSTWNRQLLLHAGPAAYSCLVEVGDGVMACLFEAGDRSAYETIRFDRFTWGDLRERSGK